jgi:hypothetical protein
MGEFVEGGGRGGSEIIKGLPALYHFYYLFFLFLSNNIF